MPTIPTDKYHLKTIHEQIDLFDRQIAHILKFEKFDSDAARDLAARKLTLKRDTLVVTAQRLAAEGIEFKPNELPRSLRPKDENGVTIPLVEEKRAEQNAEAAATPPRSARGKGAAPYTGSSLDWQASVREYMEKKGKG
jgi:hypothetical protein